MKRSACKQHHFFEAAAKNIGIESFLLFLWLLEQGLYFIVMLIICVESIMAVQIINFLYLLLKHLGSFCLSKVKFI